MGRRFAILGTASIALGLLGCGAPPPAPPPHIVLITIDTLRADHLSSYGYVRATSPNLDALAAESVRFERASVQWPKTGPSFASMLSATYPNDNGIVRHVGIPLSCRMSMLAEQLAEHGYDNHAVVANGALASELGFDQGFTNYIETWKQPSPEDGSDPDGAEAVNRHVETLLGSIDPTRPTFLWVHYLDPHHPYAPPAAWRDRFVGDDHYDPTIKLDITGSPDQEMVKIGRRKILEGRDELAFYVARYDEEIAYVDAQVGELLAKLEGHGLMDHTVTVMTSDHGESLGEHHYHFDHGRFSFQTCLHVPFMIRYPGVLPVGVDAAPVALIDLTPTLLELAGVPLENGVYMQGESLVPRMTGAAPPSGEEVVFSEAGYADGRRWQRVASGQRFKLIHAPAKQEARWIGGPGVPFALYDLAKDPGETRNVADDHPEQLDQLTRALRRFWNAPAFDVAVDPETCGETAGAVDPETEEQLRALGYL